MEDVEAPRELPLLAQLIYGSYQDRKAKESKGLAHDSGLGAGCVICGSECSGFELHFWRKVCKNCGCRPQHHNIKVNETVHQGIVRDLFTSKDTGIVVSKSKDDLRDIESSRAKPNGEAGKPNVSKSKDDLRDIESSRAKPNGEAGKSNVTIPTIKVEAMTIGTKSPVYKQTTANINERPPEAPQTNQKAEEKPEILKSSGTEQQSTNQSKEPPPFVRATPKEPSETKFQEPRVSTIPKCAVPAPYNANTNKSAVTPEIKAEPAQKETIVPVPPKRKESIGEVERQRKLLSQLPPQDFDPKFCSTLNRRQKQAMNKMGDIKKEAAGKGKLAGNDINRICRGCKTEISPGEKAVSSSHKKQIIYWHQGCFKCNSCNETIVDYIYFWHEDQIYCGRHFSEQYRPRCAGCDELIYADTYTKAEGQSWHMEHFACFKCDKSLTDASYISHKGQPHCMMCYHSNIASKCTSCALPIQVGEERISYGNMHWHADQGCFFCRGCSKNLIDVGFLLFDNKLYCSKRCSNQ